MDRENKLNDVESLEKLKMKRKKIENILIKHTTVKHSSGA
jgi:hypothetical protein